jgi:hypothetical protein
MKKALALALLIYAVTLPLVYARPITPSRPHTILYGGPSLSVAVSHWKVDILEQDPDPIIITGHGGSVGGLWFITRLDGAITPVESIVARARKQYPSQRIYLLVCNPGNITLDIPGVTYALKNVWLLPDSVLLEDEGLDEILGRDSAGSLDEFIHNPW